NTPAVAFATRASSASRSSGETIGAPSMPTAPAFATAATSSIVVTPGIDATWIGALAPTSWVNLVSIIGPFARGLGMGSGYTGARAPSEGPMHRSHVTSGGDFPAGAAAWL